MKGSMLEGKRYSTMARSQSGIGGSLGSLGSLGITTGRPKISKGSMSSFSSSSSSSFSPSSAAGASSFFSSGGGGGGGGGALLGAAEIRQKLYDYVVSDIKG